MQKNEHVKLRFWFVFLLFSLRIKILLQYINFNRSFTKSFKKLNNTRQLVVWYDFVFDLLMFYKEKTLYLYYIWFLLQ